MFGLINNMLLEFRECFKREKTWQWFAVHMIGLMIRNDHRGVTSTISSLRLKPELYHTLLHFFRSTGYKVEAIYSKWIRLAMRHSVITRIAGRVVLLGDHIKVSKEGRRMPGIQILHQESANSGKPEFITGHNFGQVSAVITNGKVHRSLPLITDMQASPPKKEGTTKPDGDTLVTQMVKLVQKAAESIDEPVVVALDAYFSSEAAWSAADRTVTETEERLVEIVTRAQTNTVAYTVPVPPKVRKRGQPRKYGDRVVLYNLFPNLSGFTQTTMVLYGKQTEVKYRCLDLIWKPVKQLVRFVAVESDSGRCVLMSTSLTLSPEDIIYIYALRFKIETSFAEQKNAMGCFSYHFWTKALPKRTKWQKSMRFLDPAMQLKADEATRASLSFVCLCTIATGILSFIAFSHNREIWSRYTGWFRTLRSTIPTISIVKSVLSVDFFAFVQAFPLVPICSLVILRQRFVEFLYDYIA